MSRDAHLRDGSPEGFSVQVGRYVSKKEERLPRALSPEHLPDLFGGVFREAIQYPTVP